MRRFLAPRGAAAAGVVLPLVLQVVMLVRPVSVGAQTWNDPRSRSLVEGATHRRAEQLADTALRDYQAVAHGYVAFLAQLGEGLRTPPKVIKTDELEDEVYWKAPNLSKQRIVGRRDTLLLPTDISYHTDHLGIVPNNFPDIIRIGDGGDEVADVPHPLSAAGLNAYDFALADSFSIGTGAQRIHVYEVRVRPKADSLPRVVGAVYIDQASSQVVRMNLAFTRAAFLDKSLEDLSLVLENRLVGGQFWLPSRQEIEIRRQGEWLDYPARGIIRGRWEIGDYKINQSLPPQLFTGPEIIQAPANVLAQHKWQGSVLDSLPPDVRAISEPEIQRVKDEARALVRAQALATAKAATLSARRLEDFVRFNRVEGLAVGAGLRKQLGAGWVATIRGRYGLDDKSAKGGLELSHASPNGVDYTVFAMRDFRDVGDAAERSSVLNSLAAQEFGSDYTDPYRVTAAGLSIDFPTTHAFDWRLSMGQEEIAPLSIHADPVRGTFEPTVSFLGRNQARLQLSATRPMSPWLGTSEMSLRVEGTGIAVDDRTETAKDFFNQTVGRLAGAFGFEQPLGSSMRLVTSAFAGGVLTHGVDSIATDLIYLGGPVSAPGYDYHSAAARAGYYGHVELRLPAPFPAFSLGRYGRVPGQATFAPYAHFAGTDGGPGRCLLGPVASCQLPPRTMPSFGAAYLTPFDLIRFDVARGVGRTGRWMFYVDVTRDFWSIL